MAEENGKELKNYTRIYNPILEAICKANSITDEPEEDVMLLIPVV